MEAPRICGGVVQPALYTILLHPWAFNIHKSWNTLILAAIPLVTALVPLFPAGNEKDTLFPEAI